MKTVSPYLNFPGHTLEAFEYYRSIFGGELLFQLYHTQLRAEAFHDTWEYIDEQPIHDISWSVEGRQEFTQLFFLPQRAPFDLWDREHRRGARFHREGRGREPAGGTHLLVPLRLRRHRLAGRANAHLAERARGPRPFCRHLLLEPSGGLLPRLSRNRAA